MIELTFPAFVTYESSWTAVPLFGPWELAGHGRDPAAAVDALESRLAKRYEEVGPDDTAALAWLSFEPEHLSTPRVPLFLDPRGADQRLVVIGQFTLGANHYVCVPRLSRWFRFPVGASSPDPLQDAVTKHLRELVEADALDIPSADVMKRDRVLPARRRLSPRVKRFSLGGGGGAEGLFAALFGGGDLSPGAALAAVASDLTDRRDLLRTLDADPRVDAVMAALTASSPGRVALVGPPGSGRTTLVHEAVARLVADAEAEERQRTIDAMLTRVPLAGRPPDPRRVYHLDPQRIVTGQSIVGQWQRRLEAALGWLVTRREKLGDAGADGLFVDDVVALARVGRSAGSEMTASTLLRDWLDRAAFPMVLEATAEQWHRLTELDRPFADRFRVLRVDPPSPERALAIAVRKAALLESGEQRAFASTGLARVLELVTRYGTERALPGALIDAVVRVSERYPDDDDEIEAKDVDAVIGEATGLRPELLDDKVALPDARLRADLAAKVVGQDEAIDALAFAVHAYKSRLRPPGKPVASFLFVGPTGVGKTEAAKALAAALFVSPDALVRFDMNAFADPYAPGRLVGSFDSPEGLLTLAIRRRPYAVLLLDEIEKAHAAVHDLLLQVLDEGRLTDAAGRTTSFANTVVVLTSNVGATDAARGVGFARDARAAAQVYRSAVNQAFRPELVNRLDRIVPFRSLTAEDLRGIARLQLEKLLGRDGFASRTVLYEVSDALLDDVAAGSFDPRFGARGLKRAIERQLVQSAAGVLSALPGGRPVRLTAVRGDGGVRFETAALAWVDPVPPVPVDPRSPAERLDALAESLEPLRPTTGLVAVSPRPPGTPDYEEVLSLVQDASDLREGLLRATPALHGTAEAHVRKLASLTAGGEIPRHPLRTLDLREARSSQGLRELLHDAVRRAPAAQATSIERDLALLELRGRTVRERAPDVAAFRAISPLRPATGFPEAVRAAIQAWRSLAQRVGSELVVTSTLGDGVVGEARGSALVALLRHEVGLHWWATDPVPHVLALSLEIHGTEHAAPTSIVRVYCPPATKADAGVVHDLRTGDVVRYGELPVANADWLLAADAADAAPDKRPPATTEAP